MHDIYVHTTTTMNVSLWREKKYIKLNKKVEKENWTQQHQIDSSLMHSTTFCYRFQNFCSSNTASSAQFILFFNHLKFMRWKEIIYWNHVVIFLCLFFLFCERDAFTWNIFKNNGKIHLERKCLIVRKCSFLSSPFICIETHFPYSSVTKSWERIEKYAKIDDNVARNGERWSWRTRKHHKLREKKERRKSNRHLPV